MPFTSVPVDIRSYKRWEALSPSDTTIYDPPPDALWISASTGFVLDLVGSDDVGVVFSFGGTSSGTPFGFFPLSVKKVLAASTATPIGLWRD